MKTKIMIAASVMALMSQRLLAQSSYERELNQLKEQHDQAMAAAIDPLKRRHQAALEQLLKRAMQANDLNAAIKIKEQITNAGAPPAPADTAIRRKITKAFFERSLPGTEWHATDKYSITHFRFIAPGILKVTKSDGTTQDHGYKVSNEGTVQVSWPGADKTAVFMQDFLSFKYDEAATFTKQQ